MVSVSSQFLKQMFTSAGYGISLSPGTLKREQNPSLLVGKLEQSYRTKHQSLSSDLTAVALLTSQQCVCLGELRLQINIAVFCGMRDYGDVMVRWCLRQKQLNGGRLRQFLCYLFGVKARGQLSLGPLVFWTGSAYYWRGAAWPIDTYSCLRLWLKG